MTTLPYDLAEEDVVLEPASVRRATEGQLRMSDLERWFLSLDHDARDRVLRSQELLRDRGHQDLTDSQLLAAAMDTALIWECG